MREQRRRKNFKGDLQQVRLLRFTEIVSPDLGRRRLDLRCAVAAVFAFGILLHDGDPTPDRFVPSKDFCSMYQLFPTLVTRNCALATGERRSAGRECPADFAPIKVCAPPGRSVPGPSGRSTEREQDQQVNVFVSGGHQPTQGTLRMYYVVLNISLLLHCSHAFRCCCCCIGRKSKVQKS